jgi:hypothetical protein
MYDEPTEQVSAYAPYRLTVTAYSSPAQLTRPQSAHVCAILTFLARYRNIDIS